MNAQTDQQLLRDYAGSHSEAAFAELVRRHIDLVYSAALRMVCDSHQAEDVTQGVFVALAQNARQLTLHPVLSGWLYRTTQNLAANAVRTIVRRQTRDQEAAAMNELLSDSGTGVPPVWSDIAPHLDAALGELSEPDRDAVLLRYFENKSAQEMAERLGISDEAAQKRVTRAVERLREFFAKRGVTIGASGLVVVISANAVQAAPVGLAVTITAAAALAGTAITSTATLTATKAVAMTTLQKHLVAATITVLAGVGVYEGRQAAQLRNQVQTLQQQQAPLVAQVQQLQGEWDSATNQLATLRGNNDRLNRNSGELLKLRGEVARLCTDAELARRDTLAKRMEDESARLPEDDPGFQLRRDKMTYLSNWGLALKVYARTNNGLLPASLAEATPSMPNSNQFFSAIGAQFRVDQFEMACQGSLTNLGDPTRIIVVKEKEPVRASNGKWARTYLFADGHTELHFAADGDFTAWEQERLPPPSRP